MLEGPLEGPGKKRCRNQEASRTQKIWIRNREASRTRKIWIHLRCPGKALQVCHRAEGAEHKAAAEA